MFLAAEITYQTFYRKAALLSVQQSKNLRYAQEHL